MRITKQSRIGFIGAGSVGKTLAVSLSEQGYVINAVASRTFESARTLAKLVPGCVAHPELQSAAEAADLIFITSSDDAIGPIAAALTWHEGQVVAHCSGAASIEVLEPVRGYGARPGAFHPLQTFSSVEAAVRDLPGSTFAIEGSDDVRESLTDIALALGGKPIFLRPEDKPLYHGTLIMVGGILNTLAGAVADTWSNFGIERNDALKALMPITTGTASTLSELGLPAAAAGPHVRGDVGTIGKHIEAFKEKCPELLPVYCHMLLAGLDIALEKGVASKANGEAIRRLLLEQVAGNQPE